MDQGDELEAGLEAAEAARAEAEAAEAANGPMPDTYVASVGAGPDEAPPRRNLPGEIRDEPGPEVPPSPICPFLRLERDGVLWSSMGAVDVDHRCAALATSVPVSEAQQSLVCLVATHLDCPRYLRGSHVLPAVEPSSPRSIPRPTIAAAIVLALSLAGTLAFTAANGGLAIPTAPSTPAPSEAIADSPGPSMAISPSPGPPSPLPASPAVTPGPSEPSPPATASAPSPIASVAPSPIANGPTADRLALLEPCPDRADCYIYTVRAGDNLTSIGLFFGVPFDTILRLNPWIHDPTTIHKGDRVILATPTR